MAIAGWRRAAFAAVALGAGLVAASAALAQGGIQRPPAPAGPDRVVHRPTVWPVGKWPEGIALDGAGGVWVAESGQRSISRFDVSDGRRIAQFEVGRLPVEMTGNPATRSIAALVNTDRHLVVWREGAGASRIATLRDCPQALADGTGRFAGIHYLLVHVDCSSGSPRVVRVDGNGNARGTEVLTINGNDIAFANGAAFVAHTGGMVGVVDAETLEATQFLFEVPAFAWTIAAGDDTAVFIGGKTDQQTGAPVVVRIDAATYATTATQVLAGGELVMAIAVVNPFVVAIGSEGTIWVLTAADLRLVRVITTDGGAFEPRGLIATADRLYVTTHRGQGENGSLLVYAGWRPF